MLAAHPVKHCDVVVGEGEIAPAFISMQSASGQEGLPGNMDSVEYVTSFFRLTRALMLSEETNPSPAYAIARPEAATDRQGIPDQVARM